MEKKDEYSFPKYSELPEIELYMDQVVSYMEKKLSPLTENEEDAKVTATMINNYVKQKIIEPPVKKRYDRGHMARLIIIFVLKRVFSISEIKIFLDYITSMMPIDEAFNALSDEMEIMHENMPGGAPYPESKSDPVMRSAAAAVISKLHAQLILEEIAAQKVNKGTDE